MFHIQIFTIGKNKETWLTQALLEYQKRLQSQFSFTWKLVKNDQELLSTTSKESRLICLDSSGIIFSSEEFSHILFQQLEKHGCKLNFVIGGSEGIPKALLDRADLIWSFSKLTFTHQQVRLILLEQIYRASEIQKGSQYHK